MSSLDFAEIRRIVIVAMFSDDVLYEQLVLKGGNAISLIYGIGKRSSIDVDFSIEQEFSNPEEAKARIERALADRFGQAGFVVFDYSFSLRPAGGGEKDPRWGGYRAEFKLIGQSQYNEFGRDIERLRRQAAVIGPAHQRIFTIDISKHEYCTGKIETELESYTVFVYSPQMIAVEKVRAICQQMPEYPFRRDKAPRARDFYDIWLLGNYANVDFASLEVAELASSIFAAKDVDLGLISRIPQFREFHRHDWPSVRDSVTEPTKPYDFYFDYVVDQTKKIKIPLDKRGAK